MGKPLSPYKPSMLGSPSDDAHHAMPPIAWVWGPTSHRQAVQGMASYRQIWIGGGWRVPLLGKTTGEVSRCSCCCYVIYTGLIDALGMGFAGPQFILLVTRLLGGPPPKMACLHKSFSRYGLYSNVVPTPNHSRKLLSTMVILVVMGIDSRMK